MEQFQLYFIIKGVVGALRWSWRRRTGALCRFWRSFFVVAAQAVLYDGINTILFYRSRFLWYKYQSGSGCCGDCAVSTTAGAKEQTARCASQKSLLWWTTPQVHSYLQGIARRGKYDFFDSHCIYSKNSWFYFQHFFVLQKKDGKENKHPLVLMPNRQRECSCARDGADQGQHG